MGLHAQQCLCVMLIHSFSLFISVSYDGQEGTLSYMQQQSNLNITESVTAPGATCGGDHTHSSNSGTAQLQTSSSSSSGMWKLSPQSLSVARGGNNATTSREGEGEGTGTPVSHMPHPLSPTPGLLGTPKSRSDNSMFGGSWDGDISSAVEQDRLRVETLLQIFKGPCLLDCIQVGLSEVDVFSARRVPVRGSKFSIQRQEGEVLKEKGAATLYIERNLYEDFCRDGV